MHIHVGIDAKDLPSDIPPQVVYQNCNIIIITYTNNNNTQPVDCC
jgi:hypothetical protein